MKFILAVRTKTVQTAWRQGLWGIDSMPTKRNVGTTSVGESGGKIAGFQASEPYVYTSSKIALPSDGLFFFPGRAGSSSNNFDFDASNVFCSVITS